MSPRASLLLLLSLGCACGPDVGVTATSEGSTGEPSSEGSTSLAADTTADDDADGSSTGEPPMPLPCANIDPGPDETCYVEHIIEFPADISAVSDQNADGRLDLLVAQRGPCCDEDAEPTGLWLLAGNDEGLFDEPEPLYETFDRFTWLIPMGPGPDGVPRLFTLRQVDVGFLNVPEYAVLLGETFIDEALPLPYFGDTEVGVADLDGDGVLDFAGMDGDAYFAVSEPGGGFEITEHPMGQSSFLSLLIGDDDGDGVDDMLLVDDDPAFPGRTWPENFIGQWSHTRPGPVPSPVPGPDEWALAVGTELRLRGSRLLDVDDDGHLDLWARHRGYVASTRSVTHDRLVLARGTDEGFAPQVETQLSGTALTMEPMLAELDGPLRAVVHVDGSNDELWLMTLSDSLQFEAGSRLALTYPPAHNSDDTIIHVADLNGDGHSDFVTRVDQDADVTAVVVLLSRASN